MTSNTPTPNTSRENFAAASAASPKTTARPVVDSSTSFPAALSPGNIRFHIVVFSIAFLLICSRRPDAFLHAQFFAEDGSVWYHDAYQFGWHSLVMTDAGYLHTLTRLIALFAQLFPLFWAPLVMNLGAAVVQVLPVNIFLSSRFSNISFATRLLASFLYLALPNTYEIDANVTTLQWHLALLACLLLLASPARDWRWRIFDAVVLILTSFDGPIGIVLVPLAALVWWTWRARWHAISLALLAPGAAIQTLSVLLAWHTRQSADNGATLTRLTGILGRQVFFSSLLGMKTQRFIAHLGISDWIAVLATALGLAVLLYALLNGPMKLRFFVAFAGTVFAMSLARPLAGTPDRPQWDWLCVPGVGNRYYFLPMLAFLSSLIWIARRKSSPTAPRNLALGLLLLLPIGIWQDWNYPRFVNHHFRRYAAEFERAPSGTEVTIPINPQWSMKLTKR
jgi:hypothetical protein